jgi:hypothetical protein
MRDLLGHLSHHEANTQTSVVGCDMQRRVSNPAIHPVLHFGYLLPRVSDVRLSSFES